MTVHELTRDRKAAPPLVPLREALPLRFITCGSVDDGKSTLIGRLLWDSKSVMEDQASALAKRSKRQNDQDLPDFALLLDGLQAEQEQGITIDVAYRYFSTARRAFIVADTPGHEQYTRNMATGASTADLAVLLVDARAGLLEQTRRHATIARLMGIRQFVLAVNKIDLVGYDRNAFEKIAEDFASFASDETIRVTAIPICALKGENVVRPAGDTMPWYDGPTLIDTLESAPSRSAQAVPLRFPVQRVSRPHEGFRGYQGTIAAGSVKPGDSVAILPSGVTANIREIVTFDLSRNAAVAGDAVTLVLDRQVDAARGDMIVAADSRPRLGLSFDATLIALQPGGISPGLRYWLKSGSRRQRVHVEPLHQLDLATRQWKEAAHLPLNAIGTVRLTFEETAIFDAYEDSRATGSFVLIDPQTNNTVAGGMVTREEAGEDAALADAARVVLSLPADLAREIMALDIVKNRMAEVRLLGGSGQT